MVANLINMFHFNIISAHQQHRFSAVLIDFIQNVLVGIIWLKFSGIDYDSESGLKLRPSSRHHLLATCRVTLSDLLFSGSLPPRLVALLQVPSSQKSSLLRIPDPSLSAMPNRLAGAIEISAFFEDTSAKRKILEEVRSLALPRAFQSLRELGFDWTSMAPSSRVLGVNRNIDLSEYLFNCF